MTIQVYKKGTSHTVRGVQCDIKNITINELDFYLDKGWHKKEGGWDAQNEEAQEAQEGEGEGDGNKKTEEFGEKVDPEDVRAKAKAAGIKEYDKKRISTLVKELNDN